MQREKAALEEELGDISNVEDGQESEDEGSIASDLYSISSFGVDLDVEALVKRLKNGTYHVPQFQRQYVWSQTDASKFIESLLLGLPVPGIFLYKESDTRNLVIDGQQRLKSLLKYSSGLFRDKKFKLTGLKTKWDGLSYTELDDDDRNRLEQAVVHATVFKQDTPTESMDSVYDLPPAGPSLMTRVCGFGLDSRRFRAGQARRARSPQIAQASGALRPVFCSRAMSVA
jgi:hypothetical protein